MMKATILLADNNSAFLDSLREYLERKGYSVIAASNPPDARMALEEKRVDLAILDLRLYDDSEGDTSGLKIAREVARSTPKIILTQFPSLSAMREALKPRLEGLPLAVDFIDKSEGPEVLLRAVQANLKRHVSKIFVVHGHDTEAKLSVVQYLERLGHEAIVLHEQPNAGRTIIEKFETTADVGYAVVLLTPDDIGAAKENPKNLLPRARQNVVFELGFFLGTLGRDRVATLCKGGVEIPSDYLGVLYIPMDPNNGWKLALAREMRYAGIDVDLNRVL